MLIHHSRERMESIERKLNEKTQECKELTADLLALSDDLVHEIGLRKHSEQLHNDTLSKLSDLSNKNTKLEFELMKTKKENDDLRRKLK